MAVSGNFLKADSVFVTWAQRNGMFFALVGLILFFSFSADHFATASNLRVILMQVSMVGIIAVPGAMLVLCNNVDLSVGGIVVLTAVVFGICMENKTGLPVAVALGLIAGTLWGFLNAILIAGLGFSPIIVTLGGLVGARGLAEFLSHGMTTFGFGPTFAFLGNGTLLSVPVPVWIFALVFLIGLYLWYLTPLGRHMFAIGGAPEAARSLGIKSNAIPFWLYVASGAVSAVCGLIAASQLDASSISIGLGLELEVLTGILLGGVAFAGGRGSLVGVLFGVLFIGALNNGLVQINISPYIQQLAVGAALILAAALDILYQRLDRLKVAEVAAASDLEKQVPAGESA
ncbi:ABC transporter permease [Corticibacterium sp. UT-5YL-CI-8]|nr:ABC transporter permease [Tianweitania sp. UT-5YL-CI-8]